ncbi:PilW family protein [Pelomicrobium methylotrophicum]|uniref:Prepilin-type N-terminal cleavage/methylation domain-containing protein n=1 Tax=Pelomicrobium methylotrophicum TaxID=2602750 RepID=A0A5C7ELR3_9PROT|nr:PilW family protein [Pelomicrobium methylotrophicum]TXF12054.1 prepilin-type N-terminal cleavage/methylation domain-containing protein [Pelomicrobium methylotrophicum]
MERCSCASIPRASAGFSLVEIMVAVAISLIGIVVVFQVFAVSEGYKRTTTSGGDAQTNGALALFTIEREVRMAGYGLNDTSLLSCKVLAYHEGPPVREFNFRMVPVEITDGASGAPDTISIMYSTSDLRPKPARLTQDMPSPSATFKVDNRYGFVEGDLIIAAEPGKDCTLAEVTGVPGTPGRSDNVIHNSGNYTNAEGQNVSAKYNKPGGLGVAYTTNGKLFNLGGKPVANLYSIANGKLQVQALLVSASATPIVDGIVQLQAEYGKDDGINNGTVTNASYVADDGIVDRYDAVSPPAGDALAWSRIIALRFAVVARSALPERPDPDGVCRTTTKAPTWAGGNIDLSADPNWRCYRYKVFETTVPIRNLIWKPA